MVDEDKLPPLLSKEERRRKRRWRRSEVRRQRKETVLGGVSSFYTFREDCRAAQQKACKKGQRLVYLDVLWGPSCWFAPPSSKRTEFSSMMQHNFQKEEAGKKNAFHPCTNSAARPRSSCPINYARANKHIWQHFEKHLSCTHITITSFFLFSFFLLL